MFQALEESKKIHEAAEIWKKKFTQGAETLSGGTVSWNSRIATSARFDIPDTDHSGRSYWIVFGRSRTQFKKNLIVEINPPVAGIPHGVQGVFARSPSGHIWVLHQGRLHPKGTRITQDLFDKLYAGARVNVRFSDGQAVPYHPVADIDGHALQVQDSVAAFVGQCNRIRVHYMEGEDEASLVERVEEAETSSPESTQPYVLAAQDEKLIERTHGKLWHALVDLLDRKKIPHTNSRVGRWGPDLRTKSVPFIMFEIKTESKATDIQRGVGQLVLYEKMLGRSFDKVLLLPTLPSPPVVKYLAELGVRIVAFKRSHRKITFGSDLLEAGR